MTLQELKYNYQDSEAFHQTINEYFSEMVMGDLDAHRTFVEHGYGFGERAFWWLWKLICDEHPLGFSFLEIGVYKGATLSLIKLLRPDATVHGVSPLTSEGGYTDSDYRKDVNDIHEHFGLDKPNIIQGLSTEKWVIDAVNDLGKWDIIYVDGGHDYETVLSDLKNYSPMVKVGGYLVMDDANCDRNLPWGYFRGHQSVTDAKLAFDWSNFEFVASVVHISVWRRIK